MFDKSISAPIGAGIRHFVREQAAASGYQPSDILVIAHVPEMCCQWETAAPGVQTITHARWRRASSQTTDRKLIIVDEMPIKALVTIMQPLRDAPQPVWLINMPLPLPGMHDYQYEALARVRTGMTIHELIERGYLVRPGMGKTTISAARQAIGRATRKPALPSPEREWELDPKNDGTK